jgi:glycosyltransferase involved in cell wall biosynthesis
MALTSAAKRPQDPVVLCVLMPRGEWPQWIGQAMAAWSAQQGVTLQIREVDTSPFAGGLSGLQRWWRARMPALQPWREQADTAALRAARIGTDARQPDVVLSFDARTWARESQRDTAAQHWLLCDGQGDALCGQFPLLENITEYRGIELQLQSCGAAAGVVRRVHLAAPARYASAVPLLGAALARLVSQALVDVALGRGGDAPSAPSAGVSARARPNRNRARHPLWLGLQGRLRAWWRRQCARWLAEYWRVGIIDAPMSAVLYGAPLPDVRWITGTETHGYFADPFGMPGDGRQLVCEFFDERGGTGYLELLQLDDSDRVADRTRLDVGDGAHVSFPNLFELDGRLLAVVESVAARSCTLYEVNESGLAWRPIKPLLNGVAAADPALVHWEGRYWLAYTDADLGELDNLCLYHSESLDGPWMPHANNPVKVDVGSARMAGAFFIHGGRLYRPAQDCAQTYGAAVVVHRIERLTPTAFEEVEVRRIEPDPHGSCPHGLHTLTVWGGRTLIDGKRHGLNPRTWWRKLGKRPLFGSLGLLGPVRGMSARQGAAATVLDDARHVALYVPHLRMGGGETSMLRLSEGFAACGWRVSLVVHSLSTCELALPLGVRVVSLDCEGTAAAWWRLVRWLRAEKPAYLLSAFPHTNIAAVTTALAAGSCTRVVVSEHAPLSRQIAQQNTWRYRLLPPLVRWAYRRAAAVVAVSKGVSDDLRALIGGGVAPTVISNPVLPADLEAELAQPPDHPWLLDPALRVVLSVCRLSTEKDLPTLLQAFAALHGHRPELRLLMAGEGPDRARMESQVREAGLTAVVRLPGRTLHPLRWMRAAAVFVLPSQYEGFGNVLVEALACGTPVVSTDCPVGPREILQGGRFGALVPVGDADAMALAIGRALDEPSLPQGAHAAALAYTQDRAAQAYLRVFDDLDRAGPKSC